MQFLKVIDEFHKASYATYKSDSYACGYLSVMLSEALARLPEQTRLTMLKDIADKTVEFTEQF
jgi:hypothetical protein